MRKKGEVQRRRGSVATDRAVKEEKELDVKDDAKTWKKKVSGGGMSRTEKIKDSKLWRTLEGGSSRLSLSLSFRFRRHV